MRIKEKSTNRTISEQEAKIIWMGDKIEVPFEEWIRNHPQYVPEYDIGTYGGIKEIIGTFVKKRNPENWNGSGQIPSSMIIDVPVAFNVYGYPDVAMSLAYTDSPALHATISITLIRTGSTIKRLSTDDVSEGSMYEKIVGIKPFMHAAVFNVKEIEEKYLPALRIGVVDTIPEGTCLASLSRENVTLELKTCAGKLIYATTCKDTGLFENTVCQAGIDFKTPYWKDDLLAEMLTVSDPKQNTSEVISKKNEMPERKTQGKQEGCENHDVAGTEKAKPIPQRTRAVVTPAKRPVENIAEEGLMKKVILAEKLYERTEFDATNADTILASAVEANLQKTEYSGIAQKLFSLWKTSAEKGSIEKLFETLTGKRFETYIEECIRKTSSKEYGIYQVSGDARYLIKNGFRSEYEALAFCNTLKGISGFEWDIGIVDDSDRSFH